MQSYGLRHDEAFSDTDMMRDADWVGLAMFSVLTGLYASSLVSIFALSVEDWTIAAWMIVPLLTANAIWISGGAATAILGLLASEARAAPPRDGWRSHRRTAVLVTICGEPSEPIAAYLSGLCRELAVLRITDRTQIFLLSDTAGAAACQAEDAAFAQLIAEGQIRFRRRRERSGKKPGNIADWFRAHGQRYDYMLVLDADSHMSAASIMHLIWQMDRDPGLGLCQGAISLVPGRTRFGRHQRVTSRMLSRTFARGFAAWTGSTGNYWGHNAIIRTMAFRAAADLPTLRGAPPFGGPILSHDFVEAAFIRREGWGVELCPDLKGSAEDTPQTLEDFFKRDRRWCQGNLQHLRLLAEPGLALKSRIHLLTGIFSYLAAPIWLVTMVLLSAGAVSVSGWAAMSSVLVVLLVPKLCALLDALPRATTKRRRRTFIRAWIAEVFLSALLAPIVMIRQSLSVAAVLSGQDCGWKSPSNAPAMRLRPGWLEAGVGLVILGFALAMGAAEALWLSLVIVPLLSAPFLWPHLNKVPSGRTGSSSFNR